jgi:hypothetical protein
MLLAVLISNLHPLGRPGGNVGVTAGSVKQLESARNYARNYVRNYARDQDLVLDYEEVGYVPDS